MIFTNRYHCLAEHMLREHSLQRLLSITRIFYWLFFIAVVSSIATAQYSQDVFSLKSTQDQYDESGFEHGSAVNVDGKLSISNATGTVSYSYPISTHNEGGYQISVALNYCGAVNWTAFKDYNLADREGGTPYSGWAKFHQQRPAWILGVNNFAVNVIATTSHFHVDTASRAFIGTELAYTDKDLIWTIDGYDWSNRLQDFNPVGGNDLHGYVDVIRILRADGSLLDLYNIHRDSTANPDTRPELYTGYYHTNTANDPSFGIVEYDSTYWPEYIQSYARAQAPTASQRAPLVPRRLHYFTGDGLEYILREWLPSYGLSAYMDLESRSGSVWGHPSIFYLEEIRSNGGTIVSFHRARHYPIIGNPLFQYEEDHTRGRALITAWDGHQLSFGYNSMMIEALGRTTQVKFDTIMRSGNAETWEYFPWANNGGMTPAASQLGRYAEGNSQLYKSFVGYVTKLVDPEGRMTTFDYETVARVYEDLDFPHADPQPGGGHQTITLKNYRLKSITEPTAKYIIRYNPGSGRHITANETDGPTLNDRVDTVRKYDRWGGLLTTDSYSYDQTFNTTTVTTKDNISGLSTSTEFTFDYVPLLSLAWTIPPGRFTYVSQVYQTADDGRGGGLTSATYTTYKKGTDIPGVGTNTDYLILPTETRTVEQGVTKSYQKFRYTTDTINNYGGDAELAGTYGVQVTRGITQTCRPDQPTTILLTDTTEYLHLGLVDSVMTWRELRWNKFGSIGNYLALRDANDPRVQGKRWEDLMFSPFVAAFTADTITDLVHMPPVYGLVHKTWRSDSSGCINGIENTYLNDLGPITGRKVRDLLIADTMLGRNKKRLPGRSYGYTEGWASNSLASTTNALGVPELYTYNYYWSTSDSVLFWAGTNAKPEGAMLSNDDSVRLHTMEAGSGGVWYGRPVGVRNIVRKYNETGNLYYDTLETYTERGFYGIATGSRDANGWYTRHEIDRNGRLVTAWEPGDFARRDEFDTVSYDGVERIDLFGATWYNRRVDQLHCYKDAEGHVVSQTITGPVTNTFMRDTFYASLPVTTVPVCPCKDDEATKEKVSRAIQQTCDALFPYNEHGGYKGFYGELSYPIEEDSPLTTATRIDSLFLEFAIASVEGECVHLTIAIDSLYSKTYVFNCSGLPYTNATRRKDGKEGGATPLGDDLDVLGSGWMVRLDLTSIAPQLRARPLGSMLTARFTTSTAGASITFVNGSSAEDLRPRYRIVGAYQKISDRADYTLAYAFDDANLTSTATAKIDDRRHTANRYNDSLMHGSTVRRATSRHYFGADARLLRSEVEIIEDAPTAPRVDTTLHTYTGMGQRRSVRDAERDTTRTNYDAVGRAIETIHHDGTHTTARDYYGSPVVFGVADQDFYGFCHIVASTDENGVKSTACYDAFDRLRREVSDSAGLKLTTRYEYDLTGRVTRIVNPKGDTTRYWYDDFGRVKYQRHPDLGIISFAYDKLGRVRFVQDAMQSEEQRLTFHQYDDLGRVTLVGDAYVDSLDAAQWSCGDYDEDAISWWCYDPRDGTRKLDDPARKTPAKTKRSGRMVMTGGDDPAANRLTNLLHADTLHTWPDHSEATANRTLWLTPLRPIAGISPVLKVVQNCGQLQPHPLLGETTAPVAPFLMHPTTPYSAPVPGATLEDFENVARHPEFVRMVIAYDSLPASSGAVWAALPPSWRWDQLAPRGMVRNQRGHEAVVAHRDRGSEPFHYTVMSYDERGRVEALLRYTENLGFDAVYYSYNALDQVTSVTVAEFLRQYTTWYGYDGAGRIDSVWSSLSGPGNGLWVNNQLRAPAPMTRPDTADIVYRYTKTGQLATMQYPPANVLVTYAYNHRKLLDSIVAMKSGVNLFREILSYDPTGQITQQVWQQGAAGRRKQVYGYDAAQRLTSWTNGPDGGTGQTDTTRYSYDGAGNRRTATRSWIAQTESYTIAPGATEGNQLTQRRNYNAFGGDTLHSYSYNANGARTGDVRYYESGGQSYTLGSDELGYNYRGLLRRARITAYLQAPYNATPTVYDWRYRYSASGEREQKRLYDMPSNDSVARYPWVYYLLGGGGMQLAVYHGQQTIAPMCGDTGRRVYMYPVEYISNGVGYTGVPEQIPQVITKPNGAKEYQVSDHLASLRVAIEGGATRRIDYDPWGNVISGGAAASERLTFNAQERDLESGLYDVTDRNLDGALGAFTRPDRLWEKFPSWSPYHYAYANPVRLTDPNGMQVLSSLPISKDIGNLGGGFIGTGIVIGATQVLENLLKHPGGLSGLAPAPGEVRYPVRILPHAPPAIIIPKPQRIFGPPPPPPIVNADGEAGKKAADFEFPTKKELAKKFGVKEKELHKIVKEIAKQHPIESKKIQTDNPDIGYDNADEKIVLKNPSTKATIKTDTPLDWYIGK